MITESDPIGLNGGYNTYAYVSANPIAKTDIYGLCSCKAVGTTGGKDHKAWDVTRFIGSKHIVSCTYECTGSKGGNEEVRGTHTEWYFLPMSWDDGREGTCLGAYFDYFFDQFKNRGFYTPIGFEVFDPRKSDKRGWESEDLKTWAKENCDDC